MGLRRTPAPGAVYLKRWWVEHGPHLLGVEAAATPSPALGVSSKVFLPMASTVQSSGGLSF